MAWNTGLDPASVAYQIAADGSRYVRVIAGPGTGKSFALKRRVARLLESGVAPDRILPVTFTKVAAEDLQRELLQMEVEGCENIRGSTLHSLGMRILSRQNVLAATGRVARPLNEYEVEPLLYDLTNAFGTKRNREQMILAYEAAWARLQADDPGFPLSEQDAAFQSALVDWLRFHRGMLIGEILPELYRYLRNNPAAPERALYDHVLVDEYQDLNKAEQAVIDFIAGTGSLCVVGDDDQSIYSFKHAHPAGIRTFPNTHEGTSDHALLQCRRSPIRVVEAANALIAHNADREPRALTAFAANGAGEIAILQYQNLAAEAEGIAAFVDDQINAHGRAAGDILVLAQRRSIGNPIHAALQARGIASKSYYQESELENETAQDRLAILKLFVDPEDRVALRWLLGKGSADFRAAGYRRIRSRCEETGETPREVLTALAAGTLAIPHTSHLVKQFHAIQNEMNHLAEYADVPDFVSRWLREEFVEIGQLRTLVAGLMGDSASPGDLSSKIVDAVSQPEIPPDVTDVRIMSLHKSKGLSSPVVIIAGCIEGLLPAEPDAGIPQAARIADMEEQRRLFYVGLTRVKAEPAANKPGVLRLTSSRRMSLADAMQSGIRPAGANFNVVFLNMSRFVGELGPTAPQPIAG